MVFLLVLSQFLFFGLIVCDGVTEVVEGKRIYNGREATIQQYPYLAQVVFKGEPDSICGAVIIGKYLCLTAGHCFREDNFDKSLFFIRAGTSYRNGTGGTYHTIKKIKTHEFYHSAFHLDYDIVIVQVNEPFKMDEVRKKMPISSTQPATGGRATIAGWGYIDKSSTVRTNVLQAANVSMFNNYDCLHQTHWTEYQLDDNHICAGADSVTRRGDSGSPLIHDGKIYGICCFGRREYDRNYPSVFVSVASLHNFLKGAMSGLPSDDVEFV